MKTIDFKGRFPYEAPVMESLEIRIEDGILTGSQVRKNVGIEIMDMDDDEFDW